MRVADCAGKMILCVTGLYRENDATARRRRRQRRRRRRRLRWSFPLAWIYSAQDATATWYLLSAGRLPTNASVIKPRECSRHCALSSHIHTRTHARTLRHLPCTRAALCAKYRLTDSPVYFSRQYLWKDEMLVLLHARCFLIYRNACRCVRSYASFEGEDRYWLSSKL